MQNENSKLKIKIIYKYTYLNIQNNIKIYVLKVLKIEAKIKTIQKYT